MSRSLIDVLQILVAAVLIALVLLQGGDTGFSGFFGGGGESFRARRGVEKILFYLTMVAAVIFVLVTVINFLIE